MNVHQQTTGVWRQLELSACCLELSIVVQQAENREQIIEVAAKLFRERGFDGIGVVELMKSAGLTHGGFTGTSPRERT